MDFFIIPLPPLSFFWVFFYLINAYTLDGQHKEPPQQQQRGQQQRKQPACQSATTPSSYS
jgi:hypothetical protein